MKKALLFILLITLFFWGLKAQTPVYNAAYAKALYAKYQSKKSNFCPACKVWVNPYYKSIADTQRHMPLITYELFTKENYVKIKTLNIPRTGIYAAWHPVYGQPNEDNVYRSANKQVKPDHIIAKGHCQAWILNAFSYDSAILSDTYTFNAACEDQGQNVGTEIATENLTRKLLTTTDVQVWCGTFGIQGTFTDGKITNTYPAYYWKIIKYGSTTLCYWMPNLLTETQAMLSQRVVSYQQLVQRLGFDPIQSIK